MRCRNKWLLFNEQGFTLIEMIIVMFILTSVTGIALISFQKLQEHKQSEYFFDQLTKDFHFAQEYALSHHIVTKVTFQPSQHYYTIGPPFKTPVVIRHYNKNIDVDPLTFKSAFRYNSNGNVPEFGRMKFKTPAGQYEMIFQIGKGRFRIEKQ